MSQRESEAAPSPIESARAALRELEARGARTYDAPACDCVHALLARADELGGGVAVRLALRAESHLGSLRARFQADQARVAEQLTTCEQARGEQTELRRWVASGDLVRAGRRLRRLRVLPATASHSLAVKQPVAAGFGSRTEGRGSTFTRANAHMLRKKRVTVYEDSVAQMVATLAMARATDVVPADAGPYNALRIASDVLERLRAISPFYLAVQLNRLEELASLLSLPELPASEHPNGRLLQQAEAEKKQRKAKPKRE
jgi:hypothetical protein